VAERVAILGAGAMGSALTAPAVDAGHDVRLWGTWLDDELVAAVRAREPHPRTRVRVDERVAAFASDELAEALDGATVLVLAITSDGVFDVLARAVEHLRGALPIAITTKGFGRDERGRVGILPPLLEAAAPAGSPVVAIGGPCKANEVAARRPTAVVWGSRDRGVAQELARAFASPVYGAQATDDVVGLEVAAAMKNVYAIALGICQGLGTQGDGEPFHNLQSAVFAQAVAEMGALAQELGGRAETVHGLAGSGDLEVTGLSGRNKVYGERLGRGEAPDAALREMRDAGQAVEGVAAARLAGTLVEQREVAERFPLLQALRRLIGPGADPVQALSVACLPRA